MTDQARIDAVDAQLVNAVENIAANFMAGKVPWGSIGDAALAARNLAAARALLHFPERYEGH